MRGKWWKRIGIIIAILVLGLAATAYVLTYTGTNIYPNAGKKHAMLRLEDVGLGGEYDTPEGLGKLRAIFAYIESEQIPYHVAVISRRMSIEEDGTWQERGIDDPNPDSVTRGFIRILQDAQAGGGLLGMHGYSHQYGEAAREDNGHLSGTGSEFKVNGAPVTSEPGYAAERITASLAAFAKNGLRPAFWESPHYRNTREQEKVFRSYVGLLYQPDFRSLRSLQDLNAHDTLNRYGQDSLGSFYVPAPFKYVKDEASVDRMLERAKKDEALASLYFHPYMDFPYLEAVIGADGQQAVEDGLPVYRYRDNGPASQLQRIIRGFKQEGWRWMSLYDIIPFSPAHRVTLPAGTEAPDILIGEVTGSGHTDIVVREKHRVTVIPGTYEWPRNRPQQAGQVWLQAAFGEEEQLLLLDLDKDGRMDLLAYDQLTGAVRASRSGEGHYEALVTLGRLPAGLTALEAMPADEGEPTFVAMDGESLVQVRVERNRLAMTATGITLPADSSLHGGRFDADGMGDLLAVSPSLREPLRLASAADGSYTAAHATLGIRLAAGDRLLTGDANGDGWTDIVVYAAETGVWRVYENNGQGAFEALANDYGPWAQGEERVGFMADMDGNGRDDIGSYDERARALDLALSFRGDSSR